MTDDAQTRAWLRDNGHDVADRGRIPKHLQDAYDAHHAANPDPDDSGVTEADFGPDEPEMPAETPPRRPRAPRQTAADRVVGRLLGSGKPKPRTTRKKTRLPRMSLEKFSARSWKTLARLAAPVAPATAACLKLQAPMAGVIMDDIARDTPLDRVLQPFARYEGKIEAGFALSTPLWVLGYEMTFAMENQKEGEIRRLVLRQLIAESLRSGFEVTEKYAEELEEARQRDERYDADVDRIMSLIFEPYARVEVVDEQPEPEMADA